MRRRGGATGGAAAAAAASSKRAKPAPSSAKTAWRGAPSHVVDGSRYFNAIDINGEAFSVGSYARFSVGFVAGKGSKTAWVAQITSLWEDEYKEKWCACKWAYFPEETGMGRLPGMHEREVLITDHVDHNTVDTIAGRAVVLSETEFAAMEARLGPRFWRDKKGDAAAAAATTSGSDDDDGEEEEDGDDGGNDDDDDEEEEEEDGSDSEPDEEAELASATYVAKSFYDYATRQLRPILRRRGGGSGAVKGVDGDVEEDAAEDGGAAGAASARGRGGAAGSAAAGASSASSSSSAPPGATSFVDLCRQAQSMLQLSAVPAKLPCREKERSQVFHFLEASIAKVGGPL